MDLIIPVVNNAKLKVNTNNILAFVESENFTEIYIVDSVVLKTPLKIKDIDILVDNIRKERIAELEKNMQEEAEKIEKQKELDREKLTEIIKNMAKSLINV